MKYLHFLHAGLFLLLISLPGLQMIFHFSKEEKLHGAEEQTVSEIPVLTWSGLLTEEFQHALTEWSDRNIGYRGFLVRSDNQLNFSWFGQISANYASPLVVGKNNSLFEKLYLDNANGSWLLSYAVLKKTAHRLQRLQDLLAQRGIGFMLLLSPSKASIMTEDVPDDFKRFPAIPFEDNNYARLLPILKESGINFLDTHRLLQSWKQRSPYPLFAKAGTHWTQHTACLVGAELLKALESTTSRSFPTLVCTPVEMRYPPEAFDRDLADLANLWHPEAFYETLPYPVLPDLSAEHPSGQPRMLFVGGSFLWSMFYYFDRQEIYSARDMFYYYSRRFHYPGEEVSPLNKEEIDWANDVFNNDIIVVEANEANLQNLGSGFVEDAIRALRQTAADSELADSATPPGDETASPN